MPRVAREGRRRRGRHHPSHHPKPSEPDTEQADAVSDDDNVRSCPNSGAGGAVKPAPPKKKARTRPQLTDDKEDLMLEFLRENPFLYGKKRTQPHDRDLRNLTWDDQASKMNHTRAILEVWYDSLRTRYGNLLKDSKKSGLGTKGHSDCDNWVITQLSFPAAFHSGQDNSKTPCLN